VSFFAAGSNFRRFCNSVARSCGKEPVRVRHITDSLPRFEVQTDRPLQFAVCCGLSRSVFCGLATVLFLLNRVFRKLTLFGYSTSASPGIAKTIVLLTSISAIKFLCLGIIGQYLALVVNEVKGDLKSQKTRHMTHDWFGMLL
jgi:hypothetical protein